MTASPFRVTRRQFVAGIGAASLGLIAAPRLPAAAAITDEAQAPIKVRVGRLVHSGLAFREGTSLGMAIPAQGGGSATLTNTERGGQFVSQPLKLEFPASHAGVYWASEGELRQLNVALRSSRNGTAWSAWQAAPVDHHGREVAGRETFSALLGLRSAEWVQYRLTFEDTPAAGSISSVSIAYLDAGVTRSSSADLRAFNANRGPSSLLDRVITREQWGADESIRFSDGQDLWPQAYVTPKLLVVHHTATDNEYADPAAEVRAIYTYHTVVQGFGDIGYHLLIDNRGQVYEGRRGREVDPLQPSMREIVSANVVAGHTLGFNYGSAGIALLGNFVDTEPSDAAISTLSEALAFEAQRAGLDPLARTDMQRMRGTDGSNVFWRDDLGVVSGHRDCIETECPGDHLYGQLPELRQATVNRLGAAGPSARLTRAPALRNLWPEDLVFTWEALDGAAEFSTRLEGFRLSTTPDLIVPLSGYTEDERELWSEWSTSRSLSVPLHPDAGGVYTMLIRARDARGREGRLYTRRAYIVGPHVWADNEDQEATRRVGSWQRVAQPMHFNGRGYEQADLSHGPA